MEWRPDRYQPLADDLSRGEVDPEVREELAHHLESRIAENLARGMSREEAERDARRRFGDLERYRRETGAIERRAVVGRARRDRLAVGRQELRRAVRALLRAPTFTVAAVVTLGLGLGAVTAIFALVDAVILRPLPYPDADRLVRIYHPVPKVGPGERWNISRAEYVHFRRESRTLDRVGLYSTQRLTVMAEGKAVQLNAAVVTATTLELLGARPLLGRLFTEEESTTGGPPPVVISEAVWRDRYGSSPAAIGTGIRLEGTEARVVGVVAGRLGLPDWRVDLWVPTRYDPNAPAQNNHVFRALARLAPGMGPAEATRELAGMVARYEERFPTAYSARFFARTGFTTEVVPWRSDVVGDADRTLMILLAAAGLLLLVAAVNVGNLFLVRSQAARSELAVRTLLGASRWQLAWHHVAESGLVALAGLVLALTLARLGIAGFVAAIPAEFSNQVGVAVPRLGEVGLDGRAIALAAGLALVAAIGFGVAPLASRPATAEAARGSRGLTAGKRDTRVRSALVTAQVALAVVLLAGAGLVARTFQTLRAVDPGFDPEGLLVAELALPFGRYQTYRATTGFYRALVDRVQELPGVVSATVGSDLPVVGGDGCSIYEYPDRPDGVEIACIANAVVGPGYFSTLGIALDGRDLSWSDLDAKTGAAAMSDALARRLFGGAALDRPVIGPGPKSNPPFRILGVTRGLRWRGLDQAPAEVGFFPLEPIPGANLWSPPARMFLVAKVRGADPAALGPAVAAAVTAIDPEVAVARPGAMTDLVSGSLLRVRLVMTLLSVAALTALLLSVVGLYGVVAYTVTARTREIGLRIAIGAPVARVRGAILRQAVVLAAVGVAIGLVGAVGFGRALGTLLYGVSPADPATLGVVAGLLAAVAVLASLGPAARAAAIDPVTALREDS